MCSVEGLRRGPVPRLRVFAGPSGSGKSTIKHILARELIYSYELEFSKEVGEPFHLYRVFHFGQGPRLYTLAGDLAQQAHLKPTDYRASFRDMVG